VTTWAKRAEVCQQYLKKGSKVFVAGRLVPDKATGGPRVWRRNDGSWGASYELTAENVLFLSDRRRDGVNQDAGEDFPEMNQDQGEEFPGMDQTAEQEIPF
jgi:single-strand DNA-binding protein